MGKLMDPVRSQRAAEVGPTLRTHLAVLLRRRTIVLICFAGVLSSTMVASVRMRPVYRAATTFQVEEKEFSVGNSDLLKPMQSFLGTKTSLIDAEVQILKSRTVAEGAARAMGLRTWMVEIPGGASLSGISIAADDAVLTGRYVIVFQDDAGRFSLLDEQRGSVIGLGQMGTPFEGGGFTVTLADVPVEKGDQILFDVIGFRDAVSLLRRGMTVVAANNTNIVELSFEGTEPEQIAMAANSIAEVYRLQSLGRSASRANSAGQFLEAQLANVSQDLARAEEALEEFKQQSGVVTLDEQTQVSLARLTDVELEAGRVEAQISQVESLLGLLSDNGPVDARSILASSGSSDPVIQELAVVLAGLEVERSAMITRYTARHPDVMALDEQITEATRSLRQEINGVINGLRERKRTMDEIIVRYEADLTDLPRAELMLVSLTRDSEIAASLYTYLLQTFQDARIAEASEIGNIRIIDPAIPPTAPARPNITLNGVLGALVGLLLGVAGAFFVDRLDNTVKGTQELEEATGLPVFGIIPEIPASDLTEASSIGSENAQNLAEFLIPRLPLNSRAAEAYRFLRTNMEFADADRSTRTVLFASAVPGEGKSTTVSNVAIAYAQSGKSVLLIDADMRAPSLNSFFGAKASPGLSEVLIGKVSWRDVAQPTGVPRLSLLPAGACPPNPVELLGSGALLSLLGDAKEAFDLVLLDSPPILGFADATVIGTYLDAAYLVTQAERVTPAILARATDTLTQVHTHLVGCVLNRARPQPLNLDGYSTEYDSGYESYYGNKVRSISS